MIWRLLCFAATVVAIAWIVLSPVRPATAVVGPVSVKQIADAITELDVERARRLLERHSSDVPAVAFERARLAIYVGDCLSAMAILSAPHFKNSPETRGLAELTQTCAGATAGAKIVEDKKNGVWIRLQEEQDEAFVPFVVDIAVRARQVIEADLSVHLPRPLRIDLVRDLFSLSAISGLPVSAAETTGTVAVARWGRVTMISPRATPHGYPWQDTLAHEIAHLALSRATRDKAPLWLQEGIAKREETRWRAVRPFDGAISHHAIARQALLSGRSVGIDQLGPSIAMLPTPEAASIAFSEVTSFVTYWIDKNGEPALAMLLADLKGIEGDGADGALRSVSGYDLPGWKRLWEHHLLESEPGTDADPPPGEHPGAGGPVKAITDSRDVVRHQRLGDLLFSRGHSSQAADHYDEALHARSHEAALRWRGARAVLDSEQSDEARQRLGNIEDLDGPHGEWFALSGRFDGAAGKQDAAEEAFAQAIGLNPFSEDVACEGHWRPRGNRPLAEPPLPIESRRRALCEAARKIPREP
jgi:tetratricopeptide (TPR) repeat protein